MQGIGISLKAPTLTPEIPGGGLQRDLAIGLAPPKEQALGRAHALAPVAVPELAPVGHPPLPSSRPGAKKFTPFRRACNWFVFRTRS